MARPKEFDVEATLDRAVDLFRQKGFSATSVQDLVEHLGINRASIYATFGTKEDLFAQVLQRYIEGVNASRFQLVANNPAARTSPKTLLIEYLRISAEHCIADASKAGCLVATSCAELRELSPLNSRAVLSGLKATQLFVRELALAAATQGELPPHLTADDVAAQAFALAISLPTLTRAHQPAETIRAVVQGFEKTLSIR